MKLERMKDEVTDRRINEIWGLLKQSDWLRKWRRVWQRHEWRKKKLRKIWTIKRTKEWMNKNSNEGIIEGISVSK